VQGGFCRPPPGREAYSLRATSGPVIRSSSGKVAAITPSDAAVARPSFVSRSFGVAPWACGGFGGYFPGAGSPSALTTAGVPEVMRSSSANEVGNTVWAWPAAAQTTS
jgi:hypothetical protein